VAGHRSGAAAVLVRSGAPVCRRTTSRGRPRRSVRQQRRSACRRGRHVRGHRADRGQDGVDPDAVRLHRDPRPSRLHRCQPRLGRRRGRHDRQRRAQWRRRPRAAVRVLRPAPDSRRPGLRRPAPVPASAARCLRDVGAEAARRARCTSRARRGFGLRRGGARAGADASRASGRACGTTGSGRRSCPGRGGDARVCRCAEAG
jgi:hypothetical protein